MKINWFTVVAQLINFLILVWLLKKFLYKPVLAAIDEREKKIVSRLAEAKATKTAATKEQETFKEKNQQFDEQKTEMLDKAIAAAKVQTDKLLETAGNDADALRLKQQKSLQEMQDNLQTTLAEKTQQQVFDISRKALTDLAGVGLEEQVVKVFISRLEELKDKEKQQFIDAFKSQSHPVFIQSAFELPAKQQARIVKALDQLLGKDTAVEFKTAPGIIGGIELNANGYKITWSIAAYLNSLQNTITETLKQTVEPSTPKHVTPKKPEAEKKQAAQIPAEQEKK